MLLKRYKLKNIETEGEFTVYESTLPFYKNMKNIEIVEELSVLDVVSYEVASISKKSEPLTKDETKELITMVQENTKEITPTKKITKKITKK